MRLTEVSYSLNEVDSLSKKAARGVGYSWGVAEEAGKATRWLCEHDIDGCAVLATLLQRMDGKHLSHYAPRLISDCWNSTEEHLCPLMTGAALSDCAADLTDTHLLRNVAEPGLLIFFAALCSQRLDTVITLSCQSALVSTNGIGLRMEPLNELSVLVGVHDVQIDTGITKSLVSNLPARTRAEPAAGTLATLNDYASRTYAPATDDSRLKGAGAGLSDGD